MTPPTQARWKEIGRAQTTPTAMTKRTEVKVDDYYLVIGFEVNKTLAFVREIHDLGVDYGHAFFYLVKNKHIHKVFSFGPRAAGKTGLFKDGYSNARPGTPDYAITEHVRAFRFRLTQVQAKQLEVEMDKTREEIKSGKYLYNARVNDTCAESAKEVLEDADIDTPSGSGKIKDSSKLSFVLVSAVNPYQWHHNIKKAGHIEVKYKPPGVETSTIPGAWHPPVGDLDPIFGSAL